jgi:DHA2 family multidrug resistance protein
MTTIPAAEPTYTTMQRAVITVPVLLASLLHAVSMTTAYVALPHMQGNLSASPDQITWVLTSYVVASAIFTAITGWVSVRFGRKLIFLISIVGFTATSLLCAAATGLQELVIYRILQGAFSAPLLPVSQAIMLDTYPRERHGFAMGIWSMGMIAGPVFGPTIGAFFTEFYSWRWVFYMNIPLGIVAFIGVLLAVPETRKNRGHMLDSFGLITLALGVGALQLMLDRGERNEWFASTEIIVEGVLAILCLYLFVAHSLTAKNPFLNTQVFRDRNFVVGQLLIMAFGLTVFSSMFLLPLFLQNVQDYPVLTSGMVLSMRGIGTLVGMGVINQLSKRFSLRAIIIMSLLAIAFSSQSMTGWTSEVSIWQVTWITIINGFGMGMLWVALTTVTFSTLAPSLRTEGAALFALIRAVGASIGISIAVTILTRSTQINYATMMEFVTVYNDGFLLLGEGSSWNLETMKGLAAVQKEVFGQAEMIGYINDFKLLMFAALFSIPIAMMLRSPRAKPGETPVGPVKEVGKADVKSPAE